MEINQHAPAVARAEIEVAAPPEIVWAVLTDIDRWPTWNPEVRSASLDGPLTKGTHFRWKAGPGTITSTIQAVEPLLLIAWTGKTVGITAIHVYRLEPRGDATIVESEESWEGLVVKLLRRPLAKTLQKTTDSGLRHLKTEAERRAATAATG